MSPFGSPKPEAKRDQTKRNDGGRSVGRLIHPTPELMPVSIDAGARGISRRSGFGDTWTCRHRRAAVPPPAALREGRLNGFPEALAEVLRHRGGGGVRRVPDAAPTGSSDARFVVQPAYSLGPHSVSPLRRLAGGLAPCDPQKGNGAR